MPRAKKKPVTMMNRLGAAMVSVGNLSQNKYLMLLVVGGAAAVVFWYYL